jgi:DNA-binding NtrC family response regulator
MLEAHRWPGNVRELRSAIARAAAFTTESEICAEDFSIGIRSNGDKDAVDGNRLRLEEVVRRHIMEVLDHHADGKPVEAARLLGIDRKTLRRKLVKYGQTLEEPQ